MGRPDCVPYSRTSRTDRAGGFRPMELRMDQLATGDAATRKFEAAFNEFIFGDGKTPLTGVAAQQNLENLGAFMETINAKGWLIYLAAGMDVWSTECLLIELLENYLDYQTDDEEAPLDMNLPVELAKCLPAESAQRLYKIAVMITKIQSAM